MLEGVPSKAGCDHGLESRQNDLFLLASDKVAYLTGQVIRRHSGGKTAMRPNVGLTFFRWREAYIPGPF